MTKVKLGARAFLRLKDLEETRAFYKLELKKEDLTEIKRDKYLRALELIEKIIKEKENSRESGKYKKIIPYDHKKAVFRNRRKGY